MKKIFLYLILSILIINGCDTVVIKENNKPSSPILTYPKNNDTEIKLDTTLNWSASTDKDGDPLKYNVFFGTVYPPTLIVSTSQSTLTYSPTLKANTTYYWKISVSDGKDGVAESSVWSFKTIIPPPSVPTITTPVNNATNISLLTNLTWTASSSSSGFTIKYNVYLDTSSTALTSNMLTKKVSSMQNGTSYTPSKLLSNTTYYWKIEADDGNGGVVTSEIKSFKTILVLPTLPILTVPVNNFANISLSSNLIWTTSKSIGGYPIKYNVFLDTLTTPATKVSSMQPDTFYTPTTLLSNTTYNWKIQADDGNGGVATSEIKSFKTALVPPSVPTLTLPINNGIVLSLNTILTWNASTSSSSNTAKYDVYLDTLKPPIKKEASLQILTSYTTPTLKANKKYYWKIIANDGNGGVTESEIDSFTVVIFDTVNVEGGTFTMGCTSEQVGECETDERPTHSVTLSNFSIGKYEVTQSQWESVMGSNPSNFTSSNGYTNCNDCPVESVSWNDIQTFLTTLNNKTGKNYRLPTEAEWEYAARGGNKSKGYKYSGSNDVGTVAWYFVNSSNKTHSIGTKNANELGIYNMSGNVWEWISDLYGSYTSTNQINPIGASTGMSRVVRGGAWESNAIDIRVSNRQSFNSGDISLNIGFRILLP